MLGKYQQLSGRGKCQREASTTVSQQSASVGVCACVSRHQVQSVCKEDSRQLYYWQQINTRVRRRRVLVIRICRVMWQFVSCIIIVPYQLMSLIVADVSVCGVLICRHLCCQLISGYFLYYCDNSFQALLCIVFRHLPPWRFNFRCHWSLSY